MSDTTNIEEESFTEVLGKKYVAYALSTIMSRSLPDVRDGLKPVHRRLLFAMLKLKLNPESRFKKCARVVGDVIGKYHPHGDTAVYDAMVRLAQTFAVRYPLVDGQGNFGSIDGDNPAAMRYTEAKMTEVATLLLKDIYKDTVDFRDNYDGSEQEPVLLPACFPNLLANGSEGIAVGMATAIPPHNADEVCGALLELIENPDVSISQLVKHVQGPDLPTGGIILETKESILKTYATGKGSFTIRAKWEKEELRLGMYRIVITEIPYQVQKSRLLEKIAAQYKNRKLPLLGNIHDESTEDVRVILEPKNRNIPPESLMESMFKITDLSNKFHLNMNVLDKSSMPQVMNLKQVLESFLAHRMEVLIRKSKFRLGQIEHRLEILEGFIIAYLNLDEIIRIIREEDHPKELMMDKFGLTDVQAEAVLNMKLRSLRKLEEIEIKQEHGNLSKEKQDLETLLNSEDLRKKSLSNEIADIKKRFSKKTKLGKRRTKIIHGEVPKADVESIDDYIEKEALTIIISKLGWIKAQKGHGLDLKKIKYKEGDGPRMSLEVMSNDKLSIFADNGRFYTVPVGKISRGKGFGEPLNLMVELDNANIMEIFRYNKEEKFLLVSSNCKGFVVVAKEIVASTKGGKQIMNVKSGSTISYCITIDGDTVALLGSNKKMLLLPVSQIPVLKKGQGVTLQKYTKDADLTNLKIFNKADGFVCYEGRKKNIDIDISHWQGDRATSGKLIPRGMTRF